MKKNKERMTGSLNDYKLALDNVEKKPQKEASKNFSLGRGLKLMEQEQKGVQAATDLHYSATPELIINAMNKSPKRFKLTE